MTRMGEVKLSSLEIYLPIEKKEFNICKRIVITGFHVTPSCKITGAFIGYNSNTADPDNIFAVLLEYLKALVL